VLEFVALGLGFGDRGVGFGVQGLECRVGSPGIV
jgi:hypothetical protein